MIIKGSSRGGCNADVDRLARHLLARENEVAVVLEGCGGPADLSPTLSAMRGITLGTRSRRALYHASISLPADEAFGLDDARWIEAVDTLQRHLGLDGHQRVVVGHQKKGRRHVHVVWCRAHSESLRIASDSHSYRKHEAASRELEERWACCRPVVGVHSREPGTPRPVAKLTHSCLQAQTRTGIQVVDVAAAMKSAWDSTTTGSAFAAAVEQAGLKLAVGRRGVVVVDSAGTPHSIPRRLGLRAAEIQQRLADLDTATLETVEACQQAVRGRRQSPEDRSCTMPRPSIGCQSGRRRRGQPPLLAEHRDYWAALGYEVERTISGWLVRLSPTTTMLDAGDTLTIQKRGEPTDDEIRMMVTAARERGWQSIRFFGGSEEFQHRARIEALRQGFTDIILECEEGSPEPVAAEMPKHIRDRLMPPVPAPPPPEPPTPPVPTPTQETHP